MLDFINSFSPILYVKFPTLIQFIKLLIQVMLIFNVQNEYIVLYFFRMLQCIKNEPTIR